ncbi:MAG: hypothetical protein ACRC33_00900, partial [Gemmataceae bacterium]
EMIDAQGRRDSADRNTVPEIIFYLLVACGGISLGVTGYASALTPGRQFMLRSCLAVLIGMVMALILDLDKPSRGWIRVHAGPLV